MLGEHEKERKGTGRGTPVVCRLATEKGETCLSLGDHESIIGLLYLVLKTLLCFFYQFIEMS